MPCPGRNAPSPPRLTPLRHPHLSHTIAIILPPLPPAPPTPPSHPPSSPSPFYLFLFCENIQKSFRMMVHDDLLAKRLPSGSRRDVTLLPSRRKSFGVCPETI